MPISASRWLSHWLLVSRFCPLVISVPMEMISVFMKEMIRPIAISVVNESPGTAVLGPSALSQTHGSAEDGPVLYARGHRLRHRAGSDNGPNLRGVFHHRA